MRAAGIDIDNRQGAFSRNLPYDRNDLFYYAVPYPHEVAVGLLNTGTGSTSQILGFEAIVESVSIIAR